MSRVRPWQVGAAFVFVLGVAVSLSLPIWMAGDTIRSESSSSPTPRWEFGAFAVSSNAGEGEGQHWAEGEYHWVGPIPYEGPGSLCRLVGSSDDGVTYRSQPFYLQAPREDWEREGAGMGREVPPGITGVRAGCRPLTGTRWEVVEPPRLTIHGGDGGRTVIGSAKVEWVGPLLDSTSFWCDVSLYGEDGSLVRESVAGPQGMFWPPGRFKDGPPYVHDVHFLFALKEDAARPVDAELDCSLDPPINA